MSCQKSSLLRDILHAVTALQQTGVAVCDECDANHAGRVGTHAGNPHAAQLLSASSASAGGGAESPGSAAAYLQAIHAAQHQHQQASQQQAALHAALLSQGLSQNPQLQPQHHVGMSGAPPAIGHLLAAGRELSLGTGYQPGGGGAATPRPASAGFAAGLSSSGFSAFSPPPKSVASAGPLLGRRSSGATEQQSDMSMWSRRSSNTAADTGLFLPPGAAASLAAAAAAAAADSSLRTASVTTPSKAPSSPLKALAAAPAAAAAAEASACQHGPMLKAGPKLQGGTTDPALPVQGHYGAMRKAGADGCTYLHTQLMQVCPAPERSDTVWPGSVTTAYCCHLQHAAAHVGLMTLDDILWLGDS